MNPEAPEPRGIMHPEIAQLKEPLQKILTEMRLLIDSGDYQLLIGVDNSGRIPTLIMSKVFSAIYREKGLPEPVTVFVAGRYEKLEEKIQLMKDHLEKIKSWMSETRGVNLEKALIVDDTLLRGNSIDPLVEALCQSDIRSDLAVIGNFMDELRTADFEAEKLGGMVFSGMDSTPDVYEKAKNSGERRINLSGVSKLPGDLHSYRDYKINHSGGETNAKTASEARHDARILAEELIKWYCDGGK
jgi:adenine/guanine phosphoribosyltransferase-like PRPP-binding protein